MCPHAVILKSVDWDHVERIEISWGRVEGPPQVSDKSKHLINQVGVGQKT